ncbi:MAG: hypothetical protein MUF73_06095 [Rhodobacteraceae bacterium]|nr:hypothetical protein [Paracoccaceae bacterium]
MRIAGALAALGLLAGCIAQVGEEGGLRATALVSPIAIAVVPVHVPQPAPAPVAPAAQFGSIRP